MLHRHQWLPLHLTTTGQQLATASGAGLPVAQEVVQDARFDAAVTARRPSAMPQSSQRPPGGSPNAEGILASEGALGCRHLQPAYLANGHVPPARRLRPLRRPVPSKPDLGPSRRPCAPDATTRASRMAQGPDSPAPIGCVLAARRSQREAPRRPLERRCWGSLVVFLPGAVNFPVARPSDGSRRSRARIGSPGR
jgi:hypothetical protein